MSANHSRDVLDDVDDLARKVRDLQGQLSARPRTGVTTLVAGAATVSAPTVTAASIIILTIQAAGGTIGIPYVFSRTAGTGFTIHSSSGTDTSTVGYAIY